MAFPVTISESASGAEAPSKYGPFLHGGALWVINHVQPDPETNEWFLMALKSIDNGVTWAEVDVDNRPASNSFVFCAVKPPTESTLYVIYATIDGCNVNTFGMQGEAWGTASVSAEVGSVSTACYRATDNTLVMLTSAATTIVGQDHPIVAFSVFDIDTQTFTAPVPLDYQDYDAITVWFQYVLGISCDEDGNVTVFMAQATRMTPAGQLITVTVDADWTVPYNCEEIINLQVFGGGGGGGSSSGIGSSGGGGGGYSSDAGPIATIPGDTVPVVYGQGGGPDQDGGSSSMFGVVAGGGGAGSSGGVGGTGGGGDLPGGDGGSSGANSGGGGGGGADVPAPAPGENGDAASGGGVAFGGAVGGGAGAFNETNPPDSGLSAGSIAGAGGGGGASGVGDLTTGGNGGNGFITFQYVPTTAVNPGRMWQQAILPDNTLGPLTLMPEGAFDFGNFPYLDAATGPNYCLIAFTGVSATGFTSVRTGRASSAVPLVFDFEDLDTGGMQPCEPAVAVTGQKSYLAYTVYDGPTPVGFVYRVDTNGSGFGAEQVLSADFSDPGCRMQIAFLGGVLCGQFAVATQASGAWSGVEVTGQLSVVADIAGIVGNTIAVLIRYPNTTGISVVVTDGIVIAVNVGTDSTGDWSAVAGAINDAAPGIVTATGSGSGLISGNDFLSGGTSSQGGML